MYIDSVRNPDVRLVLTHLCNNMNEYYTYIEKNITNLQKCEWLLCHILFYCSNYSNDRNNLNLELDHRSNHWAQTNKNSAITGGHGVLKINFKYLLRIYQRLVQNLEKDEKTERNFNTIGSFSEV